ncbi:hypothetical protein SEA_JUICYJAY_50 [Mycobacterium phage JuicyJay]|nr:hypothetical protein CONSTELLA_40 [Mycobacterium phage Constella]UEM46539.1 hypothetical protein SEA_JUICYJAY_50 [Mycobacterium phage JuicyJay]
MPADIDVKNQIDGVQGDGSPRPWAWVRVRARTVLGNLKNKPFSRDVNGKPVASTPSALDHIIGASEQTSWRYIASDGRVYDLKDACLIAIELLLDSVPAEKLAEYRNKASQLRPWPAGYAGRPDFE